MNTSTTLEIARNRLCVVWFAGSFIPFFILVVQSILGRYGDDVQKVWAWFVPNVSPTLALILGIIGASALTADQDQRCVKQFFLTISSSLSITYLVVLTLTLVLEPLSALHGMELYAISNYWLSPIQSLSVAAITVLFTSQTKIKDATAAP